MSGFKKTVSFILCAAMVISTGALTPLSAFAVGSNTPETASELILDEPQIAEIVNPDDIIYFTFTPEETRYYEFFSESENDTICALYDADMEYLDEDDDSGDMFNFSLRTLLTAGETYYFEVLFLDDSTGEFPVTLRAFDGIVIVSQTEIEEVKPGEKAVLSVEAISGMGELTYQWNKIVSEYDEEFEDYIDVFVPIDGATESIYETEALYTYTSYACEVSDGVNAEYAYVEVYIDSGLVANTDGDPVAEVYPGEKAELSVIAGADYGDVYYQWYEVVEVYDEEYEWYEIEYVAIDDATGSSYTTPEIYGIKRYACEVSDDYGNTVMAEFTISVINNLVAYAKGDRDVYVQMGAGTVLEVEAYADYGELSYQWYQGVLTESEIFGPIWMYDEMPGETDASLTVDEVTGRMEFVCVVSDEYGNYEEVYFSVFIDNGFTLRIVGEDTRYVEPGASETLEVIATANEGDITYQWVTSYVYYDGEEILSGLEFLEDVTGPTLTLEDVSMSAYYYCLATDAYDNSDVVMFDVIVDSGFVVNTPLENEVPVNLGESTTLVVDAEVTTGELTYFWFFFDEEIGEYVMLDEETANAIEVGPIYGECEYGCLVIDEYGNFAEVMFTVTVNSAIVVENLFNTVYADPGETVELSVEASSGTGSELYYSWEGYVNVYSEEEGWNIEEVVFEETGSTLTLENIETSGEYLCVVEDEYGNSEYVWFSVIINSDFVLNTPEDVFVTVNYGEQAELTVDASSENNIYYSWGMLEPEIVELPDADGSVLTTDALTEDSTFICVLTDAYGNMARVWFYVTVEGGAPVHEFGEPGWVWSEDLGSARAMFVCKNEIGHVETVDADITVKETAPTCKEEGSAVYTATVTFEGETYTDTKAVAIEKLAHTPGEAVKENAVAATCTEKGSFDEVVYCTVCGEEISRETVSVDETGHSYGAWTKLNDAQHTRVCSNDASHVETAAHSWDEGVITTPATTEAEGVKTYTCTVCGATKTEVTAKEEKPVDNTDDKLMLGDMNLDGVVNAQDARLALRQAVKLEHYAEDSVNFKNGDVNFSGDISADDARSILRAAVKLESPADWLANKPV